MKNLKMPTSRSYDEFLIELLKDPQEAAGYLESFFEEENPEPELLKLVLSQLFEALAEPKMSVEQAKFYQEELAEILSVSGNEAIYRLGNWLKALGLKLNITVKET